MPVKVALVTATLEVKLRLKGVGAGHRVRRHDGVQRRDAARGRPSVAHRQRQSSRPEIIAAPMTIFLELPVALAP